MLKHGFSHKKLQMKVYINIERGDGFEIVRLGKRKL
uniref:Uncharacterized protein n=1 Tax=Rhizophora mucronata TaxID=61149 RepID=A0A2P2N6W1_RHIMU